MARRTHLIRLLASLLALGIAPPQFGQTARPAPAEKALFTVTVIVVDDNGVPVPSAEVLVLEPGYPSVQVETDRAGRSTWEPHQAGVYTMQVQKPGFYQISEGGLSAEESTVHVVLTHEQVVQQEVNVVASAPGIDPEETSDQSTLTTADIVNVPFPVNRNLRNLLPFNPGVVADNSGQVHVAGGETYMTLDTLDGFDIRSPINGALNLRVSTDAVRTIDTETTRYPVEFGRSTAGVIALDTGMGDNKFRYNATDFLPSVRQQNGVHFDKFAPRFTVSGPIERDRSWFFDGAEMEYSNIYIPQLPPGADTDHLIRAGNLAKTQINVGASNKLNLGFLINGFHSPYDGLSAVVPQQSTDNHDIVAWLPYVRDQQDLKNGTVVEAGFAVLRYREGFEPHGTAPFELTPELPNGSNFETLTSRSLREEGYLDAFLPQVHWRGTHQLDTGIDLDHVGFDESVSYAPVSYLAESGALARRSLFPQFSPFAGNNAELGGFFEDRWTPRKGLLVDPGLRFDWDEIVRRPLFSPRIAVNYAPPGAESSTKLMAGVGIYYEHTQLEYLTRSQAGVRYDTYYAADGVTPLGPPQETSFTENNSTLREARAVNWSGGLQQKLPGEVYLTAAFMQRRTSNEFVYANQNGSGAQPGNYVLTNGRQDHYHAAEFDAQRTFAGGYTLFASYTRSSATTNAALDYVPTVPILGMQQGGPLSWDTPNRLISWGWLPAWVPYFPSFRKNWDFVYTFYWRTGFPYTSINDVEQLVGTPGSNRFPEYLSISPGLEWRFHLRGNYFGLRGIVENVTDRANPYAVYNNVDSPLYGTFTEPLGRAFTTRIRLIESSK